jgi:two-component system, OmpR family, phosphate regulon sensor histidine kinase PhoR
MKTTKRTSGDLQKELDDLRIQLQEANDLINAIRTGQVDALVVENGHGHQLYTLKSADQTYRVFIEKMKEGAVTLNESGIILYSNSQFASMVDLPLTKVIGMYFQEFIPSEYKEAFDILFRRGWESDSKGEIPLRNKNGEMVPFLLSFTSLELDEGTALSVILTDLTLSKQVERQLKLQNELLQDSRKKVAKMNEELEDIVRERTRDLVLSREHFKFLADNIPVIVWTARPDGTIDYFNKLWTAYSGLTLDASKHGLQTILHPNDFDAAVEEWKTSIGNKNRFEFEYRLRRERDGEYRWHLGYAVPFKDEHGQTIAWFGTFTDIEDQKRQLAKKDEFISVASHELKTPLTSLKAYIQLISNSKYLPEDIALYVKKANQSVNRLQSLISDLLDVSKIQAGKLTFTTECFNLSELIASCVENISHVYASHSIKKKLDPVLTVKGNAERIEQVVMNLVSNSVKYSPARSEIIITAEKKDNAAVVTVTDFGIGLSDANQQRIFERFYRVENTSVPTPGLGMGLYIASEIIKEHNGRISVKSRPHEGATFSFYLPLAVDERG